MMAYLDHAATTPLLPEVTEVMLASMVSEFGNPSSVHSYGRRAKGIVEDARDKVAAAMGALHSEITFTGGGTEADNLALKGPFDAIAGGHVIVSAIEHRAVLDTAKWLERQGATVAVVSVGEGGIADPRDVAAAVTSSTVVVSVMAVNNEIGTIQPIADIAAAVKAVNPATLVHTDAVQALGNLPVDVNLWGVDLASFAAHKLGGPKGVGALFVRSGVRLTPLIHGGGHERGLRSGTSNVAGIAGFGMAAEIAAKEVNAKGERLMDLRGQLLDGIRRAVPGVGVNGDLTNRIPGNLNVSVPGAAGETLLMLLDQAGIACSSGSACASGAIDPSHVLLAIGTDRVMAAGSLRLSMGRSTTEDDISSVLEIFPEIVERARRAA
ncbi:MAG: cysteine desulfurase [Actinomycetota bacterium]|nr:cysteine desulfurase [Actinomycetota bacterium]